MCVIRHKGAKHFYYHGKEVPFYEKYFLDFAAIVLITAIVVAKIILSISSTILSSKNSKNKTE